MFKLKKIRVAILTILTAVIVTAGIFETVKTSASTPGTSNPTVPSTAGTTVVTWTGSIPPLSNATSDCSTFADTPTADQHISTINVPSGIYNVVNASFKFEISWTPVANATSSDEVLTVLKPDGTALGSSDTSTNTETVTATNLTGGAYKIVSCGYVNAQPQTYTGKLTITTTAAASPTPTPTPGGGGTGAFGGPDPTTPGSPRYQNFFPPAGSSAQSSSGEFNIGYNPKTGRIMTMNTGPIWRLTPGELQSPAKPECCEALWEDKSNPVTNTGLDPILFTDSGYFSNAATPAYVMKSGRTFSSNATAGANGAYGYTDNDGELWTPIGAAPPNGADHQTIGSGPFPASLNLLSNQINQGQFVVYCSQDLVGSLCQRSLDLGASYGLGVPGTGPGTSPSAGCGGLHGHVRIAPDGTAWMTDNSCSGNAQGGAISIDSSTTPWGEFVVKKTVSDANGPAFTATSQANGADPSVGLDANSTAYYCYVNNEAGGNEGHAHVAVGKRVSGTTTINWIRDTDVGLTHGIVNAAQTEAIGGIAGRAACGFLGTNVAGNYQSGTFPGVWYAFIATTYDEGRTWVTVNATPNDPVQSKTGIWQQGGSGENNDRNLLDFNEMTVDKQGRVLYGYSDGCVSAGCIAGTTGNDKVAYMRVARQTGGRNLFSDPPAPEPVAPKPSCLSGVRDTVSGSHLNWKIPDNGGSDIVNYRIKRSKTPGNEVLIGETGNNIPKYDDAAVIGDTTPHYYYVVEAVNQNGTVIGSISNEVDLVVSASVSACNLPGITVLDDTNADGSDADAAPNIPPDNSVNVRRLSVAEPFLGAGVNKLVFTLQVAPSTLPTPPNSQWLIIWNAKNPDADFDRRYVAMVTDATGAVSFDYGKFGIGLAPTDPNPNANAPNRLGAADSTSSYTPATGVIKIVLDTASAENIATGETLGALNVRTYFNRPDYPGAQRSQNNASDITGSGTYTLVGNASCGVQVPVGLESDVLGSTVLHTTDGIVDSTDVAQTRRFQTGFDQPYAAGEFQRADSAPLATFGDGYVDALDVAQARRYQAGLDPLKPAAGPSGPASSADPSSFSDASSLSPAGENLARKGGSAKSGVIRVVSQKAVPGETVTVALETDAKGSESIYGFTLGYDTSLLTYVPNSTVIGAGASGASVLTNAETPGQIGLSVDFAGHTIAAGSGKQLITMQFKVAEGKRGGSAALTFGDAPAKRSVASNPMTGEVRSVAAGFVNGTVEVAAVKPRLAGRVVSALGRGVAGAQVRLTDGNNRQLTIRTNSFGYYHFENLAAGKSYSVATTHPRFRFMPQAVIVNAADEETNVTAAAAAAAAP